ncbi:MAG: 4Fe-4S binding protein [Bacteroidales bacterium]|nr:4Fe-4S binding protein [Bacteroidales bacterium]
MSLSTIYTEKNNCQDCYKCIRRCPVKAIKIDEHRASIVQNLCIYCGKCVMICPAGAKKVRNDLSLVKYLLQEKNPVILSLAPSFRTEFADYNDHQLLNALKKLGFYAISETALGADIVSKATSDWLQKKEKGVFLSSACPVVVQLISKYYKDELLNLAPFDSPMQAHAKYLRKQYGEHVKVVFAGPCIAKKQEAEEFEHGADVVLTFSELRSWLQEETLDAEFLSDKMLKEVHFEPQMAGSGAYYPVDGGMIATLKDNISITDTSFMSFSGIQNIKDVLDNLHKNVDDKIFLELLACDGGCINGTSTTKDKSLAEKRYNTLKYTNEKYKIKNRETDIDINFDLKVDYGKITAVFDCFHSDQDIQDALKMVGKLSEKDELNCGGCGYETCRHFAKAMLDGKAERHMCVSYMRRVAQNKASALLQKMPYGVVLVDEKLKVIESNQHFADMLGVEAKKLYEAKPGLEGADFKKLISGYKLFANALEKGIDEFEKDIRLEGKLFHLSIFSIHKFKIVCGIIYPLNEEYLSKDYLINKLKDVISDNLAMAQKTAFLLGENASRTETKLNTIIDSYCQKDIEDE